jgi:lysophospholipase L1-like esterase
MSRRWALVLIVLALVGLACKNTEGSPGEPDGSPPAPVPGFPSSMVAIGDSLTAAYGSCLAPVACPRNSWSTGDGTQVYSHYRRIRDANPAISGHTRNLAQPGARVADLAGQAGDAARQRADYVTILVGGNDACSGTMTTAATFRRELDGALATIKKAMPKARVLVVSIPDIYRVWEVGHTSKIALAAWKSGTCPNLLANPTSTAAADVARRKAFRDRITAYNGQIKAACAGYGSRCRFDNVATFAFKLTMLSAIDFFHPNAAGQEALARESYPGSFTW